VDHRFDTGLHHQRQQAQQMVNVGVHPAIRDQADQMQVSGALKQCLPGRKMHEAAIGQTIGDAQ
jgi:hypothetical protein